MNRSNHFSINHCGPRLGPCGLPCVLVGTLGPCGLLGPCGPPCLGSCVPGVCGPPCGSPGALMGWAVMGLPRIYIDIYIYIYVYQYRYIYIYLCGPIISVLTVGPSGADCSSIQAAVNCAPAGARILIAPGVYREQVRVLASGLSLQNRI